MGSLGASKVDLSSIWAVILNALGHHVLAQIMLWTVTFQYVLSERFLETSLMDFWLSKEAQNLKNHTNSRFDQRQYKMATEQFRDRF